MKLKNFAKLVTKCNTFLKTKNKKHKLNSGSLFFTASEYFAHIY